MKIAYRESEQARSKTVLIDHYPESTAIACSNFKDIFDKVSSGECDKGLIPVENSCGGKVSEIHELLPKTSLKFVAEHFHTFSDETITRYVVLAKEESFSDSTSPKITSFVFTTRSIPASLYKALGGFATNSVNMTKLESYMDTNFTAAQFLADIEGDFEQENVKRAFNELGYYATVKILGSYPASEFRNR